MPEWRLTRLKESSASPGTTEQPMAQQSGDVIDLTHRTAERPEPAPRLDTRNARGPKAPQ